jgi:Tfp pilus assembly protein PilX
MLMTLLIVTKLHMYFELSRRSANNGRPDIVLRRIEAMMRVCVSEHQERQTKLKIHIHVKKVTLNSQIYRTSDFAHLKA